MLRLHLPPNLAAAAGRDAIPLRVDLDLSTPPPPEFFPALALLQRWCGKPTPPKFLQLTRAQFRELTTALHDQPVFLENNQLTTFRHPGLLADPGDAQNPSSAPTQNPPLKTQPPPSPHLAPSTQYRRSAATPLNVDGSEHFLALQLPSREHPRYDDALALVKENGFVLETSNRRWWLRDRHKVLNFLAAHLTRLRTTFDADFTPNFERNTAHLQSAEVAADIVETGSEFSVSLGLRAGDADEATVRTALATNRGYLESAGKVFLFDPTRLQKLAAAQRALAGDPTAGVSARRTQCVSAARTAEAQEILEELSPGFQPPDSWKSRSAALRNLTALQPAPLAPSLESLLRPYQKLGVAWLWHLHRHELGGILADEMGLGKTLQALGLLSAVQAQSRAQSPESKADPRPAPSAPALDARPSALSSSRGPTGRSLHSRSPQAQSGVQRSTSRADPGSAASAPALDSRLSSLSSPPPRASTASLVIAPASLLENWRREAARFAPHLRTFVHHGDHRLTTSADFAAHDLVITSYGTLARDQTLFTSVRFATVIADEAQHIKNRRSQNAAALRALDSRARFLLTGTPVENSLDDLRSLFEFLLPGYLQKVPTGLRGDERAWFDQRLRAQTAPYILRRTKRSVAPELPARLEQVLWCELTPAQAKLYRETQERSERELFDLEAGGASEAKLKFAALTQLLRLRQICCDPRLVAAAPAGVPSSEFATPATETTSSPANPKLKTQNPEPQTPSRSAKAVALDSPLASAKTTALAELLDEALDDGHRVLVFSQFTSLLALLRADLAALDLEHCYLDGSMSPKARQAEVDRFQASPDIPLFLLSLKAGGTGLNLTGADTVVHFDPWWNPAAEAQATDRAHRIGQTRVVTSYKLIASGTVEEKVLALQEEKRALLADVFEASDAAAAKLSLADLKTLLK